MGNNRERPWYKDPRIIVPAIVVIIAAILTVILAKACEEPDRDFGISIDPMQGEVELGGTIQTTITVSSINGYDYAVSLSASEQPANMIITFVPPIGGPAPAYTSTMLIDVAPNVPEGRYSIIVKGTGADGTEHACMYNLLVFELDEELDEEPVPEPEVKITDLSSGDRVNLEEVLRGTSQNIPEEQVIWIVIYPREVRRYYPQDYPVEIQAGGDWTSSVYIGIEADVGKTFDIIAVLADQEAQDAFNDYLEECQEEKSWPGLEVLPEGAVIHERITVTRR